MPDKLTVTRRETSVSNEEPDYEGAEEDNTYHASYGRNTDITTYRDQNGNRVSRTVDNYWESDFGASEENGGRITPDLHAVTVSYEITCANGRSVDTDERAVFEQAKNAVGVVARVTSFISDTTVEIDGPSPIGQVCAVPSQTRR